MTDPREIEALCAEVEKQHALGHASFCVGAHEVDGGHEYEWEEWGRTALRLAATLRALVVENAALRQWKAEAIAVAPPLQEIGRALGVSLGDSIHDKILPGIDALTAQLAAARADTERLDWLEAQAQRGKDDETQEAFYDLSSVRLNEHTFGVWCVGGLRAAIDAAKGGA